MIRTPELKFLGPLLNKEQKNHTNIWHISNFSVTPGHPILPAGCPNKNVYVLWVPHTTHKLLTPGHHPRPPGQSPEKYIYVYVPFPFLTKGPSFAKTLFIIESFVYHGVQKCGRKLVNQLRT